MMGMQGLKNMAQQMEVNTDCPRSLDPFCIVTCYIKWAMTVGLTVTYINKSRVTHCRIHYMKIDKTSSTYSINFHSMNDVNGE